MSDDKKKRDQKKNRFKKPAKDGRPRAHIDKQTFDNLLAIGCQLRECAEVLGVSEDIIESWCKHEQQLSFLDYRRQKASKGHANVRRKQYEVAMDGNVSMLIWLGKNWLKQSDKIEHSGPGGEALTISHFMQEVNAPE